MFELADVKKTSSGDGYVVGEIATPLPFNPYPAVETIAMAADSVGSFIRGVLQEFPQPKNKGTSSRMKTELSQFHSLRSWSEAVDTYLNHPEKVRAFTVLDKNIKVPQSSGNEVVYEIEGDWLDVDRYLRGEPECFGQATMGNPTNLFANVVVNLTASADTSEDILRRRGERLVRLIDWLESQRIRTQILGFSSNQTGHIEVKVKRYEDSLDTDALAVFVHPDFFRRICFRVKEHSKTWQPGYGSPTTIRRHHLTMPTLATSGILIWSENHDYIDEVEKSFDTAENSIERMLEDGDTTFSMNV